MASESRCNGLRRAALTDDDSDTLRRIYASDQEMYPAPLTFDRLASWVATCPELSISFSPESSSSEGHVVGMVIALPLLREHWQDLLVGKLKEPEVELSMFPQPNNNFRPDTGHSVESEVGLHVFHIERFNSDTLPSSWFGGRGFAEYALQEVIAVATRKEWRIIGFSALTVTEAGRRSFGRLGFKPTGYQEVFTTAEGGDDDRGDARVEMACVYPGDGLELDVREGSKVVSVSEMLAKYLPEGRTEGQLWE
ncbi:hypothetical protein QBC46DRAFT_307285 [Diplogelasinospora grovesii]|uniref:Uncharacterized protein n=1 Tax=Diplogelasinospora grovesii TaxID=303347 RepID=A0AAN6ND74_9PEZI|nr:hypothetical protein QBC46DRAFT_307285 [Diplogelasinospora grovesii]